MYGVSARERALGSTAESEFQPATMHSLADAERYLYAALTAGRFDEREHWMALHFLAVGSALHLLEDMAIVRIRTLENDGGIIRASSAPVYLVRMEDGSWRVFDY